MRSLRFKVNEIKLLIKEHNPHLIGVSEAELSRDSVHEDNLKIPGYSLLFPKSWSIHGFARIVVYVKKTFKYEQVSELEDDQVQSIWLKGGYNRSKEIFFGLFYREHLGRLSRSEQQNYPDKLLSNYGGSVGANETHVCGD